MKRDLRKVGGENILIVDDSDYNLQILSATLCENGYTVQPVVSSSMALTIALEASPDLILLDIKMPDMDGYEVFQLFQKCKITCHIPIIFLSSLHDVSQKIKAFKIGGADYITKPFQVEEVLARVEHQLTIQRNLRQINQQNQQLRHEIAQRRKAELEAVAASQAKSNFLANMSHELRTPLNTIIGFSTLMSHDSLLNTEQQENIRIINRSAEHLVELINDVLELSKIEAGVICLNKTNFDLYGLLGNLKEMFQIKVQERNIKLNFILMSNVPQYIKTDEQKLRSCLNNLIANAIKFTPQGTITLRVSFAEEERKKQRVLNFYDFVVRASWPHLKHIENKMLPLLIFFQLWNATKKQDNLREIFPVSPHLLFQVEDTGCGISASELDKLFDAFTQTEAGRKSLQGTGLGLAITRKFVQMMGGEITVKSIVGKGSIFTFDIGVDIASSHEVSTQLEQKFIGLKPSEAQFKILVVDECKENRLLLVKLLQNVGFDLSEAENGQMAISIWESWKPHLILMDTQMPVMDGVNATQRLRLQQDCSLFIIAITASNSGLSNNQLKQAGFDDVIRKPLSPEIVLQKIAEYLKLSIVCNSVLSSMGNDDSMGCLNSEISDTSLLEELMTMPRTWLLHLHQAANEVNEDLLQSLIEEIPENKASLSQSLTRLVKNFRLDIIIRFTHQICSD